jgi:hypothetical protein
MESDDKRLRAARKKFLRSLDRAGVFVEVADTDDDLIVKLETTRGEPAGKAARAFLGSYRRARFAGEPLPEELPKLLEELDRTLRQSGH